MCQTFNNLISRAFLFAALFAACIGFTFAQKDVSPADQPRDAISTQNQADAAITLNADEIQNDKSISLSDAAWKYHAGDDVNWAAEDFPDGDWKSLTNDQINKDLSSLENWNGRAWFRQRIAIDEKLSGVPVAFRMWQWGATEIYLDGNLIKKYGAILPEADAQYNPHGAAIPVVFSSGGTHTIAIRYSFAAARDLSRGNWIIRGGQYPGFQMVVESWAKYAQRVENQISDDRTDYSIVGVFFALALIHFLLFIFYRAALGNLFYSFFVLGLALSFLLQNLLGATHFGASTALIIDISRLNIQALAVIALLAFLYVEFAGRPSKFFWFLLVLWTVNIGLSVGQFWKETTHFLVLLMITFADCLRITFQALKKTVRRRVDYRSGRFRSRCRRNF